MHARITWCLPDRRCVEPLGVFTVMQPAQRIAMKEIVAGQCLQLRYNGVILL
jgi:hypothetical protein